MEEVKRLEVDLPGIAVQAQIEDAPHVITLGTLVQFHPGIPEYMREMTLEMVLRHWKREVGSVTRTRRIERRRGLVYLRGWDVKAFREGTVVTMRIAYRKDDEEQSEAAAG